MSFHGLFKMAATIRSNLKTFYDTFKAVVNGAISYQETVFYDCPQSGPTIV